MLVGYEIGFSQLGTISYPTCTHGIIIVKYQDIATLGGEDIFSIRIQDLCQLSL